MIRITAGILHLRVSVWRGDLDVQILPRARTTYTFSEESRLQIKFNEELNNPAHFCACAVPDPAAG